MDTYRVSGNLHDRQARLCPLASRGAHNFTLKSLQIVPDNTKNTIMIFDSPLSVLRLFLWRRSTGLEHLLQHLEPHPCLGLVLTDCQVVCQIRVAHQTGKCVPGKVAQKLVSPSPKFLTCADELPTQTWWCQHGLCPCTWTGDAPSGRGC